MHNRTVLWSKLTTNHSTRRRFTTFYHIKLNQRKNLHQKPLLIIIEIIEKKGKTKKKAKPKNQQQHKF